MFQDICSRRRNKERPWQRCVVLLRMQWSAGSSLLCSSPCRTERMLGLWTNCTRNRCDYTSTLQHLLV